MLPLVSPFKDFLQVLSYQNHGTMTYQTVRGHGHSEQRTSPRKNNTARTIVYSSKPASTTPPVNHRLNNRDNDHPTSAIRHVRLSNRLQIPGHAASPTTCPGHQDLFPDPLDSLWQITIKQLSLNFRYQYELYWQHRLSTPQVLHNKSIDSFRPQGLYTHKLFVHNSPNENSEFQT